MATSKAIKAMAEGANPLAVEPKRTRADSNAVLRKIVGTRMVEARKLNGWDQTEAADKLGYSNSTQLSLAENGSRLPPHEVLIKASTVYGVSVDYLLGLSDEPERDPKAAEREATLRHVHHLIHSATENIVRPFHQYIAQGGPSVQVARRLMDRCQEVVDELRRVRTSNAKVFDEKLKGSAKLLRLAETAGDTCAQAREMLDRHDRLMELKQRREEQRTGISHPLFDLADAAQMVGGGH